MKYLLGLVFLIARALGEAPAPYPASGWRPQGPAFELPPVESNPRLKQILPPATRYGAPDLQFGTSEAAPQNQYGAPVKQQQFPQNQYGASNSQPSSPVPQNQYGAPFQQTEIKLTPQQQQQLLNQLLRLQQFLSSQKRLQVAPQNQYGHASAEQLAPQAQYGASQRQPSTQSQQQTSQNQYGATNSQSSSPVPQNRQVAPQNQYGASSEQLAPQQQYGASQRQPSTQSQQQTSQNQYGATNSQPSSPVPQNRQVAPQNQYGASSEQLAPQAQYGTSQRQPSTQSQQQIPQNQYGHSATPSASNPQNQYEPPSSVEPLNGDQGTQFPLNTQYLPSFASPAFRSEPQSNSQAYGHGNSFQSQNQDQNDDGYKTIVLTREEEVDYNKKYGTPVPTLSPPAAGRRRPLSIPETPKPEADAEENIDDASVDQNISVANAFASGKYYLLLPDGRLQKVIYKTTQSEDEARTNGFTANLMYQFVEPIKDPIYTVDGAPYAPANQN